MENQEPSRRELFAAFFGKARQTATDIAHPPLESVVDNANQIARAAMSRRDFGKITGSAALATQMPAGLAEPLLNAAAGTATQVHPVFGLVARFAARLPDFTHMPQSAYVRAIGDPLKSPEQIAKHLEKFDGFIGVIDQLKEVIQHDPYGVSLLNEAVEQAARADTSLYRLLLKTLSPGLFEKRIEKVFSFETSRFQMANRILKNDPNDPFSIFDAQIRHMLTLWEDMSTESARNLQLYSMFSSFCRHASITHDASTGSITFGLENFAKHDRIYATRFFSDLKAVFAEAYPVAEIEIKGNSIHCRNMPEHVNTAVEQQLQKRAARGDNYIQLTHSRRAENFYGTDYHRTSWGAWEKKRAENKPTHIQK